MYSMSEKGCFLFTKPLFNKDNNYLTGLCFPSSFCLSSQLLQEDGDPPVNESLSIENTLWASTVVASGKYVSGGAALSMRQLIPRK